ncbi:MAG: sigma-70 family RNA polymerase sigma factor [Phycisphaeraceae bacterium]
MPNFQKRSPAPIVEFPSSHWSTVIELSESDGERHREMVGDFLNRYYDAMKSYLWTELSIQDIQELEDILQSFVTDKLICEKIFTRAERSKGKLRNYIKRCLKNYAIDCLRKRTTKRNSVNRNTSEESVTFLAGPDKRCIFEVQWAQKVVQEALELFRVKYEKKDTQLWQVFVNRILEPTTGVGKPATIKQLSEQLGMQQKQVHNKILTARRGFQNCLHQVVSEYTGDPQMAKAEIADLLECLASARHSH